MPSQQHLYDGLASTADYYIFRRNRFICLRASQCLAEEWARPYRQCAGLQPSWLAYGQHSEPILEQDRHQDGHQDNGTTLKHNVPVAGYEGCSKSFATWHDNVKMSMHGMYQ